MPNQQNYDILDSFVLRESQMPVSLFIDLVSSNQVSDSGIKKILARKAIRESIFIASPTFWGHIEKWEKGHLKTSKKSERIKLSLLKYLARLSTRATPFGLFAGCSVHNFNKPTKINGSQNVRRKTYLSSAFIENILKDINDSLDFWSTIKFHTNDTIVGFHGKYRYIKQTEETEKSQFAIEEVSIIPELSKVLKTAKHGACLSYLTESITGGDISPLEAKDFINELVQAKLLLSELSQPRLDNDYLYNLVALLRKLGENKKAETIEKVLDSLKRIDMKITNEISEYKDIINDISKLDYKLEGENLFHINSYQTNDFHLQLSYKQLFLKALKILRVLNDGYKNRQLEHFKKQFNKRYSSQKKKLLEAIDPDYGIDYLSMKDTLGTTEILKGINLKKGNRQSHLTLSHTETILSRKIALAIQNSEEEITLKDSDFKSDLDSLENLPNTFSGIFEIIEGDKAPFVRLKSLGGSSGTNLISRFALGNRDFANLVNEISEKEETMDPVKIGAELVHVPEGRLANILMRPNLRRYEIPILSPPHKKNSILLEDLSIFLRDGDLILKSDKLNKEIVPHLSNAHNFESSTLPIYRFLCDLQGQSTNINLSPDLSFLGKIFPFIPRITYQGIIISPARWQFENEFLSNLFEVYPEPEKLIMEMRKLRIKLKMPKLVSLIQGENEILVNLENIDCLKYFIQLIRNQSTIILHEFFFDSHHYKNGTLKCANEIIVTYIKKT